MAIAPDDTAPAPRRRAAEPAATGTAGREAQAARMAALRRIVTEASANLELADVFEEILESSQAMFGADVVGLWLLQPGRFPFRLAAHRNLDPELVEAVSRISVDDAPVLGLRAIREAETIVVDRPETAPRFAGLYSRLGIRTMLLVPMVARTEALGLLAMYHRRPWTWTTEELELCAAFANRMAAAVANAQLYASVRDGAARLRAIQELSSRLNRIQDVEGIGEAIVAEADQLIAHDTIRVYRVDHTTETCEPIAFQGEFLDIGRPPADLLRMRIGDGLTGWVALHNRTIRLGDAAADPRGRQVGGRRGAESMLVVPMSYESRVLGVIVVSKGGYDRFSEDDQRTLEIFAGYAAQALVNAEAFGQVRRQQEELHHRLESQRRLLEVNERLLATLDPGGVLEMIADSLRAVVAYDSLTIYRVDREAWVRRAMVSRDRYADLILSHEGPLDAGITGWAIRNGEAVLANDAHRDPRSIQIPGTPEEPESMIVCPLLVAGEVVGTLNLSRMGGVESHFSRDEFELAQLFAAQASIALRNAETHGAMVTRAEHDALTGLRNHGAFQRELGQRIEDGSPFALLMLDLDAFKAYNDRHGHPAGDTLLARVAEAMRAGIREQDRVYRYGGDEFAILLPRTTGPEAREVAERVRCAVAQLTEVEGPLVTVSVGIACFPEDARKKDELVAVADRALYLAKPSNPLRGPAADPTRDPYLAAMDDTAFKMLERLEPRELLQAIVERAARLVGVPHGYLYLLEPADGGTDLVVRVATGLFRDYEGYRLPRGRGAGWTVVREGRPVVIDDYDTYEARAQDLAHGRFGAVCAVPLTSGGEVLGVIGLASGDVARPFTEREVEALTRFAQLASIALDNARLFERVQTETRQRAHAALHDPLTGLPNRSLLLTRLAEFLEIAASDQGASGHHPPGLPADGVPRRPPAGSRVGMVLLDLDRFTMVNESLGHRAGDQLLAEVAARLTEVARGTDTVARLGSDEFGVLLAPVRGLRDAERVVTRLERALAMPFDLDGREIAVGASIGLAVGKVRETHAGDLLKEAEIALHRAKADPVRSTVVFDPEMRAQTLDRITMEHDLRRAVERGELRLHYQPLVDLADGTVVGMEALVRWQHPDRGLVAPLSFIPLAEETGLILPIGRWVLETACWQLRDWQHRHPAATSLVVSVNLSARQFAQADLVRDVASILDRTGLDPASLELEITESVVMDQSESSVARLHALRALGVRLVLDDFGTGYSSLAYLRRLPLDTIKIDRSFVAGLGSGEGGHDAPIVKAVISLAHGLGIDVVAEGIETTTQLEWLRSLDCDRGQGYLYAAPLPAPEVEDLFASGREVPLVLATRYRPLPA